ncbi:ABC transporter substrate-binding protein [Actinophytocola algeriensis]|uniref:Multiple sugar transport system substrate-binding protein n=1 Tax=Actinophytocola algeriensis TaxID=1768010 RepID=A0A7W7VDJ0_9PSEU|nr:sugar ABC transporter substrate-binding protein [Actinophytocola algeriensis]MBB4906134.1 multiple sugar transport system substrate-binding protein [Actinophytocola algeriensis]MBE1472181.1 multiple sugar transport system substrate-binding protein [Actinophytocola algeriensis]
MGLRGRLAGLAAVAAALVISGCAGPGSGTGAAPEGGTEDWGEPKGTIEFWDTNANPRLTAKWEELIARFEKDNPEIKVDYVGLPNSSYLQKVQNALATGEIPDVLLIGNDIASLIAQKALVPVDDAFTEGGLPDKVDKSMVETERGNSADRKLYKAPLTALSDVIWYRKDWLAEANLAEPKSYDEFFAAAEALTNPGANRFGFAFRGGPGSMPPLLAMTYGMSGVGEFFTEDGKATLDDPENVEAFKRYAGLYGTVSATADISNDYPKIVAAFDGGSAWAMHHNLGSYQDHVTALGADKVAGVQPFPDEDGVITATSPAISGLSILAGSEKKAAAWEFVEYMSTEANSEWAETVGQVPAFTEAQKGAWVEQSQPIKAVVEAAENPKTRYVRLPTFLPDWGAILKTEMEPDFQAVLQKTMPAEEFLSKYAARFEEALAEYKENAGK